MDVDLKNEKEGSNSGSVNGKLNDERLMEATNGKWRADGARTAASDKMTADQPDSF